MTLRDILLNAGDGDESFDLMGTKLVPFLLVAC